MAFWQSLHTPAENNDLCELCIVRNNDIWCFHGSDFNAFSFASQVNGFIRSAHTVFVIFVKSETPHYTQNTYDLLTDHSLKVRHTSFHAKLLCGQQDMMSHSMASVLVIRMQGTGYDVTLYSICFRNIKQHSCLIMITIRNVSWAANQHIIMISEESCDTEDY